MVEINEYRKELKSRIIDYAMGEFYKRGVRAVKMDEISQGLHVSKRTVYEIFGDKEELLLAGLKIKSLEMREKLETYSCNVAHNVVDIIGYFYKLIFLGKPAAELALTWNITTTSVNAVLSVVAASAIYMALRPALIKSGLFIKIGK